ncbi:MAG: DUF4349 domain-containing protein [Lawsonibacter sp.]|nr:DUF4349 domain-containing protein [Lawsonibacter sp.]
MKRNPWGRLAPLLALILLLASCGGRSTSAPAPAASAPGASAPSMDMAEGEMWNGVEYPQESSAPAPGSGEMQSVYQNPGVKLIRRAELNLQTTEFDRVSAALDGLVSGCGGYFESKSVYGGSYRDVNVSRSGEYIVRIPAERYESFLAQTGELGYITSKTESSENIGEQYYDTQARLKTQQTKQERLLDLLSRAESMEDIISLENALSEVEYQIEQYSSTLSRYDSLVGFSTISIWLQEVQTVTRETGVADSLGTRMAAGLVHSGASLVSGFQEALVWLSYHVFGVGITVIAAAAGGVILLRRKGRSVRRKKDTPQDPPD